MDNTKLERLSETVRTLPRPALWTTPSGKALWRTNDPTGSYIQTLQPMTREELSLVASMTTNNLNILVGMRIGHKERIGGLSAITVQLYPEDSFLALDELNAAQSESNHDGSLFEIARRVLKLDESTAHLLLRGPNWAGYLGGWVTPEDAAAAIDILMTETAAGSGLEKVWSHVSSKALASLQGTTTPTPPRYTAILHWAAKEATGSGNYPEYPDQYSRNPDGFDRELNEINSLYPVSKIAADAKIAHNAILGDGVTIQANAVIETNARIGSNATIGRAVHIKRDTVIGETSMMLDCAGIGEDTWIGANTVVGGKTKIGANVSVGDNCKIGKDVDLGDGSTIGQSCTIGDGSKIGAGAQIRNEVLVGDQVKIGDGVCINAECAVRSNAKIENVTIPAATIVPGGMEIQRQGAADRLCIPHIVLELPHD